MTDRRIDTGQKKVIERDCILQIIEKHAQVTFTTGIPHIVTAISILDDRRRENTIVIPICGSTFLQDGAGVFCPGFTVRGDSVANGDVNVA